MKVKLVVPEANNLWKIQVDHGILLRKDAVASYSLVERRLLRHQKQKLASAKKEKIDVSVEYGQEGENQGEYETMNEAMYSLACFLEDVLPLDYARIKYKKYCSDY